jgi:hypothetical protein
MIEDVNTEKATQGQDEPLWPKMHNTKSDLDYLSWEQISSLQRTDKQAKAIACALKFNSLPVSEKLGSFVKNHAKDCKMVKGVVVYHLPQSLRNEERSEWLVFAPEGIRSNLCSLAHDNPFAGHFATVKTLARLQMNWYWPGMRKQIHEYCRACVICNKVNPDSDTRPTLLEPMPPATLFNQRVHCDLLGPLPLSGQNKNKYLLVMTDAYSSLMGLAAIPDKQADTVATTMVDYWVCHHGVPTKIHTDQGSEFTAHVFQSMCQKLQIAHSLSSVGHPQSNAKVERQNRIILAYYRKYLETNPQWEALLPAIMFSYNTAAHIGTGYTPYFKAYLRRPKMPSSLKTQHISYSDMQTQQSMALYSKVNSQLAQMQEDNFLIQKRDFDKRARAREFKEGDKVFITRPHSGPKFQKFQPKFEGPYLIVEKRPHNTYLLWKEGSNKRVVIHANRIKLAVYAHQRFDTKDSDSKMWTKNEGEAAHREEQQEQLLADPERRLRSALDRTGSSLDDRQQSIWQDDELAPTEGQVEDDNGVSGSEEEGEESEGDDDDDSGSSDEQQQPPSPPQPQPDYDGEAGRAAAAARRGAAAARRGKGRPRGRGTGTRPRVPLAPPGPLRRAEGTDDLSERERNKKKKKVEYDPARHERDPTKRRVGPPERLDL